MPAILSGLADVLWHFRAICKKQATRSTENIIRYEKINNYCFSLLSVYYAKLCMTQRIHNISPCYNCYKKNLWMRFDPLRGFDDNSYKAAVEV